MTPAPAVRAFCYMPRINHGEWVDFLIDTGASGTCLNGIYAMDLQRQMLPVTLNPSMGIGGNCNYFHERCVVVFVDDAGKLLTQDINIGVLQLTLNLLRVPNVLSCPCLLGRDILNKCSFQSDYNNRQVKLVFN